MIVYPLKDYPINYVWEDPSPNTAEIAQLCSVGSPQNAYYTFIKDYLFCSSSSPLQNAGVQEEQQENNCAIKTETCKVTSYDLRPISGVTNFVFTEVSPFIVGQENTIRFEGKYEFHQTKVNR